jgi:PKD repeat protein
MELTHLASSAPPWARSVATRTRIPGRRAIAGPSGAAGRGRGHAQPGLRARVLRGLAALATAATLATALAPSALGADPPVATIVITGTAHFADQEVAFADESTGEPDSRTWSFGDGDATSTRRHPTHTYHDPGTYTVTLTVENAAGTDVATVTISILGEWTGGVQVYRAGAYSKQATMRLCVAASVQMMRNMVYNQADHSLRYQSAYNAYGRAHNGYVTPPAAGVDPAGMQAMLRRYVHPNYRIAAAAGYTNAVRAAARAIRLTGRPASVFVMHGRHVWVISGFTATADPAVTTEYVVTSVSVEGPLFGVRPAINGYDPAPNVTMTVSRFARYLTPFRDPYEPHGWRNRYVVVIP